MNTKIVPLIALRYIHATLPTGIKCTRFVCMMYHEAGLSVDFSLQPLTINCAGIGEEDIGKLLFLMNKKRRSHGFNHVAIIYDRESVIHYSRHSSSDGIRRVQITFFENLFKIYDQISNPYHINNPRKIIFPPNPGNPFAEQIILKGT